MKGGTTGKASMKTGTAKQANMKWRWNTGKSNVKLRAEQQQQQQQQNRTWNKGGTTGKANGKWRGWITKQNKNKKWKAGLNKNLFETKSRYKESLCAHQQAIAYRRWAHTVGKDTQCMADEQFHFADNKWDVTKNNNNKNKNKRENKQTNKQQ